MVDGEVTGQCHRGLNYHQLQAPVGLWAVCSQPSCSQLLPSGVDFRVCETAQECASDTIISILQRGATAEDLGWGLSWEGPIGSCSVTL